MLRLPARLRTVSRGRRTPPRGARIPAGGARNPGDAALAGRVGHWCSFCVLSPRWGSGGPWFGKVDIVAVASGKIVSQMRTKLVQPFETSTVLAILVSPGQKVRAGDALIELDPTAAIAERDRAASDLRAAKIDQARLEAFLDGASEVPFAALGDVSADEIKRAQAQLKAQNAERLSKLAAIAQERLQRAGRTRGAAADPGQGRAEPALRRRARRHPPQRRRDRLFLACSRTSESQQLLVETKSELEINRAKIASLDAAIDGLGHKLTRHRGGNLDGGARRLEPRPRAGTGRVRIAYAKRPIAQSCRPCGRRSMARSSSCTSPPSAAW